MNEIKGSLEPSPFLVVWKSGSWVMGVGSGEWGVGNEDEETGVSISLVSEVFYSKVSCTAIFETKSCLDVKN